jgi:dienelactone hydrolase
MARPNVAEVNGYRCEPYEAGGMVHDVYRGGDSGPVVLLLHEMPSFSWRTVNLANCIQRHGYRVVMPILVGGLRDKPEGKVAKATALLSDGLEFGKSLYRICVSWEFVALHQKRTSPITLWLLDLARTEAAKAQQRQVGVIGMCFSGGFALATAIDPIVGVAVVSQPALPFANGPLRRDGRERDLGLSEQDHERLLARKGKPGFCVAALRYQDDDKSPAERVKRIKDELGASATLTWIPGRGHPVLTDATDGDLDTAVRKELDDALASVFATLDARLKNPANPG